jgi:MFS family permease
MGVVTALSAIDAALAVTLTLFTLSGAGMSCAISSLTSIIQQRCPAELRGRVMALWLMSFLGLRPLAASLNGLLADVVSLEAAYLVSGGLVLAALVPCRPRRLGAVDHPRRRQVLAPDISSISTPRKGIA